MVANKLVYQDVPSPKEDDPASLITAINALRQNVQALTGGLAKANPESVSATTGAVSRTWCFRKTNTSDAPPVGLADGDLWLQPPLAPGDSWIKQVWFRGQWIEFP